LLIVPTAPAAAQVNPAAQRRTAVVDVFEQCKDAVVNISSTHLVQMKSRGGIGSLFGDLFQLPQRRQYRKYNSVGSGFILHKDGYIVTNAHVVARTAEVRVIFADQSEHEARIVAMDEKRDLAIIKIEPDRELKTLKLGSSSDLMVGETVIAIGNPFHYQHTVTSGVVSALDREIRVDRDTAFTGLIQTDASINPGNSGGPLLNVLGELVGVNTAIRGDAQNIGFAIPVDDLRKALPLLLDVERRYHIVTGMTVSPDKRRTVTGVTAQSPADAGGIRIGDRIETVDGEPIASGIDYEVSMLGRTAGDEIPIRYSRRGVIFDIVLTLAKRPRPQGGQLLFDKFGIQAESLTPQKAGELNLSRGVKGILVTKTIRGSAAWRAKFKRGDIIISLGRYQVTDMNEAGELLDNVQTDQTVTFGVLRLSRGAIFRQHVQLKAR
jgi:serine protease Do